MLTGPSSEDFALGEGAPPRRWPHFLHVGFPVACALWAVAWALGADEVWMVGLAVPLIVGFVLHLAAHLVSMVWLGPVTAFHVSTTSQRTWWKCTRRVGWVERDEYLYAVPEELELRWSARQVTFFSPRGFVVAALEDAAVERLATRAARALGHRAPEQTPLGLTSRGVKAVASTNRPLRHDFWSSEIPDLPGSVVHGAIVAVTVVLWATLVTIDATPRAIPFLLAACGFLIMLVTGIVWPRTHEWRGGYHSYSTSAAHQFVDGLFVLLGCHFLRIEAPGRTFFFVWGLVSIGLASLLSGLRFKYRDRAS